MRFTPGASPAKSQWSQQINKKSFIFLPIVDVKSIDASIVVDFIQISYRGRKIKNGPFRYIPFLNGQNFREKQLSQNIM